MENELSEDELKATIKEAEEKMNQENDFMKNQRKAALTWNIIFFVGILVTTISISVFIKFNTFNLKEFLKNISSNEIGTISALISTSVSFLIGVLGSYFKTKSLKSETTFNVQVFLKEAYFNRLDKSQLNPNNRLYDRIR